MPCKPLNETFDISVKTLENPTFPNSIKVVFYQDLNVLKVVFNQDLTVLKVVFYQDLNVLKVTKMVFPPV